MVQQSLVREKGILRLNGIGSKHILSLLVEKHAKDVFIPECKNGETWGARDLLKLDVWVLKRSYSPLTTIGYEIKCSRQDFEKDLKWTNYLDLCHQFYFVCPAGLIRVADLPSRVGLIWVTKGKLHTKRRAERVEPDIEKLNHLLIYVVMARSDIVANMFEVGKESPKDRVTLIKGILKEAKTKKELASFVRGHIREIYEVIQKKDMALSGRERDVKRFEERLAKLGIVWNSKKTDWEDIQKVVSEIDLLKEHIDYSTLANLKSTAEKLGELVKAIEKYRGE